MKKRLRHRLWFKIAGPILRTYLKKKFNFTYEKCDIKPPFIVLGNHTTDFDPFFVASLFKCPIYFVMSDHVSSLKAGKLIRHLVSPIPITKSSVDAETVKNIFSITEAGGAVGIFPEGNKSFAGTPSWIKPSTAKLAKKLGVPIVIQNTTGGYFSSPRWSKVKRKGHIHSFVFDIITVDEIEKMTNDELYKRIVDGLNVNAYEIQEKDSVRYIAENKAENIEALLYACPNCNSFNTVYGEGEHIKCTNCDLNATYTDFGYIENAPINRLDEWDKWQKQKLRELDLGKLTDDEVIADDDGWEVQVKETKYKSQVIGNFKSILTKTHLTLKNDLEEIKIQISDIKGTAIEGTCSLQLLLSDGTVYRLKNELHCNGLKYVNFISHVNNTIFKF